MFQMYLGSVLENKCEPGCEINRRVDCGCRNRVSGLLCDKIVSVRNENEMDVQKGRDQH